MQTICKKRFHRACLFDSLADIRLALAYEAGIEPFYLDQIDFSSCHTVEGFRLAGWCYFDQFRASGEPFITHPVAVLEIMQGYGFGPDFAAACLLHDVLENCLHLIDADILQSLMGKRTANLVLSVTRDRSDVSRMWAGYDIYQAGLIDWTTYFLKGGDRFHNQATLKYLPPKNQLNPVIETLTAYKRWFRHWRDATPKQYQTKLTILWEGNFVQAEREFARISKILPEASRLLEAGHAKAEAYYKFIRA